MKGLFVLQQAKREAEARLAKCKAEGKAGAYKLSGIQQDIKEIDEALSWVRHGMKERTRLVQVNNLMEKK